MTHKQRKWIQETKSRPLRAGQTFSSRNASIKQDYDGRRRFVTFDTTIQGVDTCALTDGGHKVGDRKLLIRDPKGHGRVTWWPLDTAEVWAHIYGTLTIMRHTQLQTLSYTITHWISSPPMEESTNTTAWTSSASATPSMTSPSTVSTGSPHVIRGVLPRTTTSAGTQDRVLSVDVLSRVVWSFVWTVKTEYTLYSSKYLRYSCKFKQI